MLIGRVVRIVDVAFLKEKAQDAVEILNLPLDGCVKVGDDDAGQPLQQGQWWFSSASVTDCRRSRSSYW